MTAHLFLHIGPMKTGSTWLQEGFRINAQALEAKGIRYPLVDDAAGEVDADERVPTGNARTLLDHPVRFAAKLREAVPDAHLSALFSSEVLFNRIARMDDLSALPRGAREAGFAGVHLLLFVRAPLPLAASVWQQRVKGWQGETCDLDSFLRDRSDWPERIMDLVDRLSTIDGIEITLRNYDTNRSDLLRPVETWLGLAEDSLARPARESVNRSLTRAEAELQRALNARLGPSGKIFAFRLVNRVPEVTPDPPLPSPETAAAVMARHTPALDRLDALLPAGEAVRRDVPILPNPVPPLAFDAAQLDVIAEGLAAYLDAPWSKRLRRTARAFGRRLRR